MKSLRRTSKKIQLGLGGALVLLGVMIPTVAMATQNELDDELEEVRQATARFEKVEAAEAAGYELGYAKGGGDRIIIGCIAHPTDGAMGYHYFNDALVNDVSVDPLQPEVLVYAPEPNGQLELVAVEWVVPGELVDYVPTVLGMDMHILVPAVGIYITHAWLFEENPSGMLADWNPNVTCPNPMSPPSTGDAGLAATSSASAASTVMRAVRAFSFTVALAIGGRSLVSLGLSRPR